MRIIPTLVIIAIAYVLFELFVAIGKDLAQAIGG